MKFSSKLNGLRSLEEVRLRGASHWHREQQTKQPWSKDQGAMHEGETGERGREREGRGREKGREGERGIERERWRVEGERDRER